MDVLELFPQFMLYGFAAFLAVIAFIAAWIVWGNYLSPAAPGVIVGYYRIFGCYAGGRLHKEFKGRLVDASGLLLNPTMMGQFKNLVIKSVEAKLKKGNPPLTSEDRLWLEEALNELRSYPASKLSSLCRVIVTRERFTKHVFIQYGNVKPIEEYASTEEEHRFTFGFGPESQGVIMGELYTFPETWDIWRIGKCQVHLFKPYSRDGSVEESPPLWMPRILLYAAPSVEAEALLESMRQQLEQKDRIIDDVQDRASAASTVADQLLSIVKGLRVEGGKVNLESLTAPKRLDIADFLMVAAPSFLGTYLAGYLNVDSYIGLFAGLAAGFIILWRKKR